MCIARHAQSTENNKFAISFQYHKENVKDEVDFCLLIIVKGFFKVILSFYMCGQACPYYPKEKVYYLLQYLNKELNDEVDFCKQLNMKNYCKLIL